MSERKQGLGLFGLLAVTALGMMAFASSALAVAEPSIAVNGAKPTEALDARFVGEQENRGTLSIPGLNTEINCEQGEITGGLILNALDAKVEKILYKECTVLSISKLPEEPPCHVSDVHTGNPSILHITALNPLVLPVEIEKDHYGILVEKISVFINFLSGTGCPLPLKTEVKGEVCFLITKATNDTAEPLIITSETIQKSCPKREILEGIEKLPPPNPTLEDKLLYGAQAAFITGAAKLKLIAPHGNLPLGVLLL